MLNAYMPLEISGVIKKNNSDFVVIEDLGVEPSGEGEHLMLWVEKNGANTEFVAKRLANYAGISPRDVSYAGVKDRHALTRQWFSLWVKNKPEPAELDWLAIEHDEFSVLEAHRHARKIKRGTLQGNTFKLIVRDLEYADSPESIKAKLQQRVELIQKQGVPNYFGEQRFGIEGRNIQKALAWFNGDFRAKKAEQTWLLSSARSVLFNEILEKRIEDESWQTVLSDDVLMLNGTQSVFDNDDVETNQQRYADLDLHITGAMYGDQLVGNSDDLQPRASLEHSIFSKNKDLCDGLDGKRMQSARRALRIVPKAISVELNVEDNTLEIELDLPSGCYATTVLKEIVSYTE